MPTATDPSQPLIDSIDVAPFTTSENPLGEFGGINRSGQVAGIYNTHPGTQDKPQVFRWTPDLTGATQGTFVDLAIPGTSRRGLLSAKINEAGVVGVSVSDWPTGLNRSFLAKPSTGGAGESLLDLSALLGEVSVELLDLDNVGGFLAPASDAGGQNPHYVVYHPDTGAHVLTLASIVEGLGPNAIKFVPSAINDAGQIAGEVQYLNPSPTMGMPRINEAVLLTLVPEPASLAAFAFAACMASRRSRRELADVHRDPCPSPLAPQYSPFL